MALEVLIVDDEADIRELVSGVLEDEGYAVRVAADSTQTLDAIEERRPSMTSWSYRYDCRPIIGPVFRRWNRPEPSWP